MTHEIKVLHEGHDQWETLQFKFKWETWEITQHSDGDVEISCDDDEGTKCLFLNQEELKQVITFLQSKVKQ